MVTSRHGSGFAAGRAFFDVHVLELAGFEDLAAFLAFDKFGVFVPADNLHARVLTRELWLSVFRRRGQLRGHNPEVCLSHRSVEAGFRRISGIVKRLGGLSSPLSNQMLWISYGCEINLRESQGPMRTLCPRKNSDFVWLRL